MKRFVLPALLFLLIVILPSVPSHAADSRSITIVYTGSVKGYVEPCVT